jgi:hypothetical protein
MLMHKCITVVSICAPHWYITNIIITIIIEEAQAYVPECTQPEMVDIIILFWEAASINNIILLYAFFWVIHQCL